MRILLLESNRDKKGTVLECMVKNILRYLKYDYIATNEVGSGGNEIDVAAERRIPSINKVEVYPVICECKAHERPIDMTDWLKFLGKVYKETLNNIRAEGLLIALNDANGNVKGDIRTSDYPNVRLLSAEDLVNVCIQCYSMASMQQVQDVVKSWTTDVVSDMSIVMYEGVPYWMMTFIDDKYSFLTKDAEFITPEIVSSLTNLISELTPITEDQYIDIRKEKIIHVKEHTIMTVMSWAAMTGSKTACQIAELVVEHSGDTIHPSEDEVVICANKLNYMIVKDGTIALKPIDEIDFVEFYRSVLSLGIPTKLYNSFYYDHIDKILLEELLHIQGNIDLNQEERDMALFLIKHSPSALRMMLYPNKMFTPQVNVLEADKEALKESVKGLLLQTLANCIEVDSDSDIAMLLFDKLEIRDFYKQTLYEIVKKDGTKITIPVSKRLYYIPFDDGGVVVQASANFIGQYDAMRGVMVAGKNMNKKEKTMFGIVKHKTGSEEEFLALYY